MATYHLRKRKTSAVDQPAADVLPPGWSRYGHGENAYFHESGGEIDYRRPWGWVYWHPQINGVGSQMGLTASSRDEAMRLATEPVTPVTTGLSGTVLLATSDTVNRWVGPEQHTSKEKQKEKPVEVPEPERSLWEFLAEDREED